MHAKMMILSLAVSILLPLQAGELTSADKLAAKKAAVVSTMHKKAKKALVNAAQDRAYVDFLASNEHASHGHEHEALRKKVDQISLNVQSRFHVEEMCLISPEGPELSRVVGNEIAYDLSPDETKASFFDPGFALRPKSVYVSAVYMSPDADKWVIAYVTPVQVEGEKKAILHYEHGLDAYQQALGQRLGGEHRFVVAVNEDGWVIADSRNSIAVTKQDDSETPADYFRRFELGGKSLADVITAIDQGTEITDEAGRQLVAAYQTVGRWTLLTFDRAS